jgi:hypothetical protein
MFNLADYETVEVRLEKFIKDYADFRISTELEVCEKDRYIVKAYIFKTHADTIAWATGLAEEKITDRGVNSTSALENCETSAIGRALANAGYAAKGKRPSRQEMRKVISQPPVKPVVEENDYWTTPIGDSTYQKPAPVTLEKAIETVSSILGTTEAREAPQCKHGHMIWAQGEKNNRAWGGYKCSLSGHAGTESECPRVWYNLSSTGTWEPQKARV